MKLCRLKMILVQDDIDVGAEARRVAKIEGNSSDYGLVVNGLAKVLFFLLISLIVLAKIISLSTCRSSETHLCKTCLHCTLASCFYIISEVLFQSGSPRRILRRGEGRVLRAAGAEWSGWDDFRILIKFESIENRQHG